MNNKKMRLLICGDRKFTDYNTIYNTVNYILNTLNIDIECIIEGGAKGADKFGKQVGDALGISVISFPAKWDAYGKSAGMIRNKQMMDEGDPNFCLAFHDAIINSKGTKDMIDRCKKRKIPVMLIGSNL